MIARSVVIGAWFTVQRILVAHASPENKLFLLQCQSSEITMVTGPFLSLYVWEGCEL